MQGLTAVVRHEVTKTEEEKDKKHIGKLLRKNKKIKGVINPRLKLFRS